MKRTVERETTKTVTETEEIDICDKCGLEASPARHLYYGPRIEYTDAAKSEMEHTDPRKRPTDRPHYSRRQALRDAKRHVELEHNGRVTVCPECHAELFEWSDTVRDAEENL